MKRVLPAVIALLLGVAAFAPAAAQSSTKYRYWQDLSVSGPYAGEIYLAIAYEDTNGNGRFTPRFASAYRLRAQTSCDPGGGTHETSGNAFNKYGFFKQPITNARFTHRFESEAEQPQSSLIRGDLNGTVHERGQKKARVSGAFEIEAWAVSQTAVNCASSGSYSATQCKRWRSKNDRPRWYTDWKAPVCKRDPW